MPRSGFRTGVASILAGALYFAGQGGEILFGSPSRLGVLWIALGCAAIVAMGVTILGLRELISGSRAGRIGIRVALGGFVSLGLFAIQLGVEQVRTGDLPSNWILFALGFVLLVAGQLLYAHDLRGAIGRAWVLPLVAVAGIVVALAGGEHAIHDIGLFVFEGAWVALGLAILRAVRQVTPAAAPVAI